MTLVGKFFFQITEEYSRSGEVLAEVAPGIVLIRCDKCEHQKFPGNPSLLILVADMVSDLSKDEPEIGWEFFDSRDELQQYLLWLETPSDPATKTTLRIVDDLNASLRKELSKQKPKSH